MSKIEKLDYLTKEDIKVLNDLTSAVENDEVVVTCMGLYNHGKSSLLNVLVGDMEEKTFKVADVRETSKNKKIKMENITYVDTPGLNAKEHDDKRVMDAAKESDLNLFVHTVTTGEFTEKEIEFLNKIKQNWKNPQEFLERTIFVVSRVDKANDETDIVKTIEKMNKQIFDIFGHETTIIPTSSTRYLKGNLEEKSLLVKRSNIEVLKSKIDELKNELYSSIKKTKIKRLQNQYDDLIKRLNSEIQKNLLEKFEQERVLENYKDSLKIEVNKIENTLESMYSKLGA